MFSPTHKQQNAFELFRSGEALDHGVCRRRQDVDVALSRIAIVARCVLGFQPVDRQQCA